MIGSIQGYQAVEQAASTADCLPGTNGQPRAADQRQGQLRQVGEYHAPQAAKGGIEADDKKQYQDGHPLRGIAKGRARGPYGFDAGHEAGEPLVPQKER